ncbi:MAG: phosphorothioated DNA-binding restriction endonuclease [Candidatus Thiodiazotropha sp.]
MRVELETVLRPLLNAYAPPVANRHQPELPYWHMMSDGIWTIPGADNFPRQRGGFPTMASLRASSGHLIPEVSKLLISHKNQIPKIVHALLSKHFPESLHEDIAAATGLSTVLNDCIAEASVQYGRSKRDPRFRDQVLRAYEHRCAVTGFRAALGGSYFGCEAAHVKWHAYFGPDTVENGLSLEPTMHKLFDAGAWMLTDDRRVLVSAEFTGSDTAIARLREHHGKPIRDPLPGERPVSMEYIRWHREPDYGGVFRGPALKL